MEKINLIVPKGIRYISEWPEYSLENFKGPHILNKEVTGCGYTEYCLRNNLNVVLCSPRRILLQNKKDQHPECNVLYAKNENEYVADFDKDISGDRIKESPEEGTNTTESILKFKETIKDHVKSYTLPGMKQKCKIIVTYDSFKFVKEVLEDLGKLQDFYVVVDEFQSLMVDSKFKSSTEVEFLDHLQGVQKLCYVSATPMLEKYLDLLEEFKDLPYYTLDWSSEDPGRIIKPQLQVKSCQSIIKPVCDIIQSYLRGEFEKYSYKSEDGKIHEIESKEAVIYVNSVKNIGEIIKRNGLTLENTNVLCSNTPENEKKIKSAFKLRGKVKCIGEVPKEGEPHKMFTLCTRTVYLGADFYSTCARTFIFSDANVDSLSVDITLDLPQILGRQRLLENPWKNRAELYYKLYSKREYTQEEFSKYLEEKKRKTNNLLKVFTNAEDSTKHDLAETYQYVARKNNFKDDFVAVNTHSGSDLLPVFNNLVMVSEMRSFEIQQVDFKDRFNLFSSLEGEKGLNSELDRLDEVICEFEVYNTFIEKMKFLCSLDLTQIEIANLLERIPIQYKNYYTVLGPERIKAFGYNGTKLKEEYNRLIGNQDIDLPSEIYNTFQIGCKYTLSQIKSTLKDIYNKLGYKDTPKAKIIETYFIVKRCNILNLTTGKKDNGLEIISKKL